MAFGSYDFGFVQGYEGNSIFYFILFYFILFYLILFYFIVIHPFLDQIQSFWPCFSRSGSGCYGGYHDIITLASVTIATKHAKRQYDWVPKRLITCTCIDMSCKVDLALSSFTLQIVM